MKITLNPARLAAALVLRVLHDGGLCAGVLALPGPGFEALRWRVGRMGAWARFRLARARVPAYRAFLREKAGGLSLSGFEAIPATDKENYVKVFPLEARCVNGRLPDGGVMIDESAGSSGMPMNWARGEKERAANRRAVGHGIRHAIGRERLFVLNAFALGPWATGVNVVFSLIRTCWVKALGPDVAKIENTLLQFGPGHHYVILGYPPFLKNLVYRARLDWKQYRVSMIFGGEGMSESMRGYLRDKGIGKIYGSYGASDLDIHMAFETDFTIALRHALAARPALAGRLLRHSGALPMIFQYNPAEFFLESSAAGEILATLCRPGGLAPKIRYNIHDLGHVMRFPELRRLLREEGVVLEEANGALDLPLLFHYGRADLSVTYFGCKIPPADVQESLFRTPELARAVDAFQLSVFEDAERDKRLVVHLEVLRVEADAASLPEGEAHWGERLFETLAQVNQDFRESRRMAPPGKEPRVEFHAPGTGPFAGSDARIKRNYVRQGA